MTDPTRPLSAGTENDSAYESGSDVISTVSLPLSFFNYRKEFGRTYHAGTQWYPHPNDETEKDCLDMQHDIWCDILDGDLFRAPISRTPNNVLDVGTGTGIWAIDFADRYPSAIVQGTDISPIQPTIVPPRCTFLVDDATKDWDFEGRFDYIHCRELRMCVEEKNLFRQAYESLQPGGWFEIVEMTLPLICKDASLEGTSLQSWTEDMMKASRICNTPYDNPYRYRQLMEEAGFHNIREIYHDVALNSNDEGLKMLGIRQKHVLYNGLEGHCVYLFRTVLERSKEELDAQLAGVRSELKKRRIHASCRYIRVFGQKPGSNAAASQLCQASSDLGSSVTPSTPASTPTLADRSRLSSSSATFEYGCITPKAIVTPGEAYEHRPLHELPEIRKAPIHAQSRDYNIDDYCTSGARNFRCEGYSERTTDDESSTFTTPCFSTSINVGPEMVSTSTLPNKIPSTKSTGLRRLSDILLFWRETARVDEQSVQRFEPLHLTLTQWFTQRKMYIYVQGINSSRYHLPSQVNSPLLLCLEDDTKNDDAVRTTFRDWLEAVTQSLDWYGHFFDKFDVGSWEKSILAEICAYYSQSNDAHDGLRRALKLTLLSNILVSPFTVRAEDLLWTSRHRPAVRELSKSTSGACVVASSLTKHIRMCFHQVAADTLADLDALFSSRGNITETAILTFCEAFLCLIVLGQCQISVSNEILRDPAFTRAMAQHHIHLIEDQLISPIIELCICKFRELAQYRAEGNSESSLSSFLDRLRGLMPTSAQILDGQTGLETLNPGAFELTNISRLLRRLCHSVSQIFDTFAKPFLCTVQGCDKRYTRKQNLETHLTTHRVDPSQADIGWHIDAAHEAVLKPFTCTAEGCNAAFSRGVDVKRHVKSTHQVELIDCDVEACPRTGENGFARKDHLVHHKRGYHSIDIPKRLTKKPR